MVAQACCALGVVRLDVIGTLVTLSERETEELRAAAAADGGRSSARRHLALLLERALRTRTCPKGDVTLSAPGRFVGMQDLTPLLRIAAYTRPSP